MTTFMELLWYSPDRFVAWVSAPEIRSHCNLTELWTLQSLHNIANFVLSCRNLSSLTHNSTQKANRGQDGTKVDRHNVSSCDLPNICKLSTLNIHVVSFPSCLFLIRVNSKTSEWNAYQSRSKNKERVRSAVEVDRFMWVNYSYLPRFSTTLRRKGSLEFVKAHFQRTTNHN